jgi:hypothetical protein
VLAERGCALWVAATVGLKGFTLILLILEPHHQQSNQTETLLRVVLCSNSRRVEFVYKKHSAAAAVRT